MRLELTRPLIFFDVETTGLDVKNDRIIEIAAVKAWPDGRQEEKCRRFNPLIPIPKEATAIHGISDEDVKNEPPFTRYVKGEGGIAAFFSGSDLAGFNIISFDIPILQAEFERAKEKLDLSGVSVIDAYRIFVSKEPRNLCAALKFYCNKDHEEAHSALGDVRATAEVLESQLKRYLDLPNTPTELDQALYPPDSVDRRGKLKWVDGEMAVAFGRHKGRTLKYLAREEPDYLRWMIDNDVAPEASHHLRDALVGHFAIQSDGEDKPTDPNTDSAE
ncbi:MAG: 3'-5' exonuclease [Proteobacteria bacterium]|nr:3'-5' exonuclease [Pseudomonadota bacterium]